MVRVEASQLVGIRSPVYLSVYDSPSQEGKGAGTRLFGFLCSELSFWAPAQADAYAVPFLLGAVGV